MSVIKVLTTTILTISGAQIARLELVVDILHVDKPHIGVVEIHTGSVKLGNEHRHIELIAIETGNVTTRKLSSERLGYALEGRFIGHHLIGDMVDGGALLGDVALRIDKAGARVVLGAIGVNLDEGDLNYAIGFAVGPGGLEIEED